MDLASKAKLIIFGEAELRFCVLCGHSVEGLDYLICRLHLAQMASGEILAVGKRPETNNVQDFKTKRIGPSYSRPKVPKDVQPQLLTEASIPVNSETNVPATSKSGQGLNKSTNPRTSLRRSSIAILPSHHQGDDADQLETNTQKSSDPGAANGDPFDAKKPGTLLTHLLRRRSSVRSCSPSTLDKAPARISLGQMANSFAVDPLATPLDPTSLREAKPTAQDNTLITQRVVKSPSGVSPGLAAQVDGIASDKSLAPGAAAGRLFRADTRPARAADLVVPSDSDDSDSSTADSADAPGSSTPTSKGRGAQALGMVTSSAAQLESPDNSDAEQDPDTTASSSQSPATRSGCDSGGPASPKPAQASPTVTKQLLPLTAPSPLFRRQWPGVSSSEPQRPVAAAPDRPKQAVPQGSASRAAVALAPRGGQPGGSAVDGEGSERGMAGRAATPAASMALGRDSRVAVMRKPMARSVSLNFDDDSDDRLDRDSELQPEVKPEAEPAAAVPVGRRLWGKVSMDTLDMALMRRRAARQAAGLGRGGDDLLTWGLVKGCQDPSQQRKSALPPGRQAMPSQPRPPSRLVSLI